jgi:hypothetical protein
VLLACEAPTVTPPTARTLTPTEVSGLTARTRTELAPRLTEALHALDNSSFLADLELDISDFPPAREVADALQPYVDAIFAESSIESRTDAEITYRVPITLCDGDADCIRALTTHPVRFVVTSPSAGRLHAAVDVGARRVRALVLDMAADSIEVDIDLDQARMLLLELSPELDIEPANLPSAAGGFIHLVATPRTLAFSSRGGAHLDGTADGGAYRLALGDSHADLDFDGAAGMVIGNVDLGAIEVAFPFGWIGGTTACDEGGACVTTPAQGQLQYAAAGLEARASFDANADELVLDDLSLGGAPFTASLDGVRQAEFDFNVAQGRRLDVSLRYLRQELEIAVSPSIEATLELSMAAIAAQVEVAEWAISDHLRLRFDGATSPTLRINFEADFARVVSGMMTLVSDTNTLSASVDQCVAAREDAPEDAGVVEALMSYPCE